MKRMLAAAALLVVACSSGPEEAILQHFFTASRLRDTTSLSGFAAVTFDPNAQGIVTSFSITNVSPERNTPLKVRQLATAHDEARAEDATFLKRREEYANSNDEAIRRILKAERENSKVTGKDAEIQAAWTQFREEGAQISRKVSDARRKLLSETAVAQLSVEQPGVKIDLKDYDGDLVTKDMTIDARVKLPDGQTSRKTLIVTMERAVLKGPKPIAGRWIISEIKDTAASPDAKTS